MDNNENEVEVSFEVNDGETVDFDTQNSAVRTKTAFDNIKQIRESKIKEKARQRQTLGFRIKRLKRIVVAVLILAFLLCVGIEYIRMSNFNYVEPGIEYNDRDNAVKAAKHHLDLAPYSRDGLIDMLEYEGFSTDDAEYAVDHSGANWKKQAYKEAQDYLSYNDSSEARLREHLDYKGFTENEIEYAVKNTFK